MIDQESSQLECVDQYSKIYNNKKMIIITISELSTYSGKKFTFVEL